MKLRSTVKEYQFLVKEYQFFQVRKVPFLDCRVFFTEESKFATRWMEEITEKLPRASNDVSSGLFLRDIDGIWISDFQKRR